VTLAAKYIIRTQVLPSSKKIMGLMLWLTVQMPQLQAR
jgi:hypothetical protein